MTDVKKIKFPPAIWFFSLISLLELVNLFYVEDEMHFFSSFGVVLVNICMVATLIKKKNNVQLFLVSLFMLVLQALTLLDAVSVFNILNTVSLFILVFIIGCTTISKASLTQKIAEKIFFVPSVVNVLAIAYASLTGATFFEKFGAFYSIKMIGAWLIVPVAYYLLARWCVDPYRKIVTAQVEFQINGEQASINNIDSSTEHFDSVLSYDESYYDLVKHALLTLFTCGIWYYIWIYKTTRSLNKVPESEQYEPLKQTLLCIFVPFYSAYWFYKHSQKIDELNKYKGNPTDNSLMFVLLGVFIPLLACILMQDAVNKQFTTKAVVNVTVNQDSDNAYYNNEIDIIEIIKEYKALLDCGAITQEEFEQKKKELLEIRP